MLGQQDQRDVEGADAGGGRGQRGPALPEASRDGGVVVGTGDVVAAVGVVGREGTTGVVDARGSLGADGVVGVVAIAGPGTASVDEAADHASAARRPVRGGQAGETGGYEISGGGVRGCDISGGDIGGGGRDRDGETVQDRDLVG